MNKYDKQIYDFLLSNKTVTLEKIGKFTLSAQSETVNIDDESFIVPRIEFSYDKKIETSCDLITYISEKLNKSQSLISSDIDSHLDQVRQFINLGKPHLLHGLGSIYITPSGEYEFSQQPETFKAEEKFDKNFSHTNKEQKLHHHGKRKNGLVILAVAVALLILSVSGWGTYIYLSKSNNETPSEDTLVLSAQKKAPPTPVTPQQSNTTTTAVNTTSLPPVVKKDSATCKFFFEYTSQKERAIERINELRAEKYPAKFDSIIVNGVGTYRLYMKEKIPLSDTALRRAYWIKNLDKPLLRTEVVDR